MDATAVIELAMIISSNHSIYGSSSDCAIGRYMAYEYEYLRKHLLAQMYCKAVTYDISVPY